MSGTSPTIPSPSPVESFWTKPAISVYSLTLLLAALGIAWFTHNDTAFNLITGAVITNASTVINYFFGSSSGSDRKTDIIASNPAPLAPPKESPNA